MGTWWWEECLPIYHIWWEGSAKHRLYIKDEETIVIIVFICKITPIKYTLIASIIVIKWTLRPFCIIKRHLSNTKYHFITMHWRGVGYGKISLYHQGRGVWSCSKSYHEIIEKPLILIIAIPPPLITTVFVPL